MKNLAMHSENIIFPTNIPKKGNIKMKQRLKKSSWYYLHNETSELRSSLDRHITPRVNWETNF